MGTTIAEVFYKKGVFDPTGEIVKRGIFDLGINGVESVRVSQLYKIDGSLPSDKIKHLCSALLADPIVQSFVTGGGTHKEHGHSIKIWFKPGVTDAAGESALEAANDMGIKGINSITTGLKYIITGKLTREKLEKISKRFLANSVVQVYEIEK